MQCAQVHALDLQPCGFTRIYEVPVHSNTAQNATIIIFVCDYQYGYWQMSLHYIITFNISIIYQTRKVLYPKFCCCGNKWLLNQAVPRSLYLHITEYERLVRFYKPFAQLCRNNITLKCVAPILPLAITPEKRLLVKCG